MSILIKNGRIVTASEDYIADLYVENDKIKAIGQDLNIQADEIIDASGKLVLPGGVDPHVHISMPFMGTFSSDDYSTGTLAALHGGTTTVIDFVLQTQGKTLQNAVDAWRGRSTGNTYGDYSFHIAVTDLNEHTRQEIKNMVQVEGITSFKVFMAYKNALMLEDGQMVQLMNEVKAQGGLVNVHATNGDMIDGLIAQFLKEGKTKPLYHYLSQPEVTEAEATNRFAELAEFTGVAGYVVHLTCEGALQAIRRSAMRNKRVMAETCIQYLMLDAGLYEREDGAKWVMSPPLREKKDIPVLWSGINQGLIQTVGTDHCPFFWEQKLLGKDDFSKIPNGMPGIENRMELLYSEGVAKKRISLNKFVEVACTNPAKIFGMPQKGHLGIGADADIVIFNPNTKHTISAKTHHMNVDYSAYEGVEVQGKCETIILRGTVAIDKGEVKIQKGYGQYIKRDHVKVL